jgi:hypothetical protein
LPVLKKYNTANCNHRLSVDLLDFFTLSPKIEQNQKERLFIQDIGRRVCKAGTVLYLLEHGEEKLGFIALSASSIGDFPSLQIDYLFVDYRFRGKSLPELENEKASTYLIEFAIKTAKDIQKQIGLRYLVLLPDDERLETIYLKMGFDYLPKHHPWMFLKL